MALEEQLNQEFLKSLKNKEELAVSTLRLLKSAILNKKIEAKLAKDEGLTDDVIIKIIKSEVKKRQDSIDAYQAGGRSDLVEKEQAEILILKKYLPEAMSEQELSEIISQTISETSASGPSNFGRVIGAVMAKTAGRADGGMVSRLVKEKLN
ncbi:MAG TPA: GatB/YqeY domain-containing protein [Patescibacteria group bacterium]|nr:GatB/YqeY domain-containing protein [Patescibacteria group bacterium]